MELIDNGMLVGAQEEWDSRFRIANTPWDYRTAWDLYQFVYRFGLEDEIRLAYLDEDDVDLCFDDLPEDVAVRLIERYVTDNGLIDRYDAWKRESYGN